MLEKCKQEIIGTILARNSNIAFAYIHGSSLYSAQYHDIDIAFYIYPDIILLNESASSQFDVLLPLERELEELVCTPIDAQILNNAPLSFRFRVVSQGQLLFDRAPMLRENFELFSRVEYFDFNPRRELYLKEALA